MLSRVATSSGGGGGLGRGDGGSTRQVTLSTTTAPATPPSCDSERSIRTEVGDATAGLVLVSAAMGAIVVCFADLLARAVWSDELPTGVIVPALGIPLLLVLLRRRPA